MPASHTVQEVSPADDWYSPTAQSVHASTADTVEYLPALHSLHELAPSLMPVFVIEPALHGSHNTLPALPEYLPAWQSLHATTGDAEYLPAVHAVHVLAPVWLPAFVTEPALHAVHDATFDSLEYVPATHAVHVVAFG